MTDSRWVQHSPDHWVLETPQGLLDYWPARRKWMLGGVVYRGSFEEMMEMIG